MLMRIGFFSSVFFVGEIASHRLKAKAGPEVPGKWGIRKGKRREAATGAKAATGKIVGELTYS